MPNLKRVALTLVTAVVLAACLPPPRPPTNHVGGEGNLIATWDGQAFCAFTGHFDIVLQDDTTLVTRTWATVTTLVPGVAPCDYSLFSVSSWLTCDPSPCGNMQLPMPHLEQATVLQEATRTLDQQRLRFHLFGHYSGAPNTAYDAVASPRIRCNVGGSSCLFYP
jgi:hypothetical protein